MFLSDSRSVACGRKPPPICGAIITGANSSMSKLTMVPWNAGSATPTTVIGTVFRCTVVPMTFGSAAKARRHRPSLRTTTGCPPGATSSDGKKRAAKLRADAKLQKVVAGDELAHHLPRSAAASDVHGGENETLPGR